MAKMNTKNIPLSTVGSDLMIGQGDSLSQAVQDSEEELKRRKQLMGQSAVSRDLGMQFNSSYYMA